MVLDLEFPTDIRVENEAISLIESGHELTLLCLFGGNSKKSFNHRGIQVIHSSVSTFRFNKSKGLASRFGFFDRFVEKQVRSQLGKSKYDCLHVHDLPLLTGCIKAGLGKISIVSDLHENYPAALNHYAWSSGRFVNKLVSPKRWQRKELAALKLVDRVIVVVEEARNRLASLGVPPEKVSIVSNTVNRREFDRYPDEASILSKGHERFVAVYVGGIDAHRGLDTMIEGLPMLIERHPQFKLLIVGSGRTEGNLRALSSKMGLDEHIEFTGRMPIESMRSFIKAGNVGVIPHLKTDHTDSTIPHKLFQYMYQSKPVLVSNCDPLARIVKETQTGYIFESRDAESFAKQMGNLAELELTKRQAMGERGLQAVTAKYNWQESARELIKLYRELSATD